MFRRYVVDIVFNGARFSEVWIDPHYEIKHKKSINDELILSLVKRIDLIPLSKERQNDSFEYFEMNVEMNDKMYRLIIVVPQDKSYLGVINAYRKKI